MGYNKSIFNDKTTVVATAVGVLALAAIAGGIFLGSRGGQDNNRNIIDLDEEGTTKIYQEMESKDNDGTDVADNDENKKPEETSSKLNGDSDTSAEQESTSKNKIEKETENVQNVNMADDIVSLSFSPSSVLIWPVEGSILVDFDMDNTVYFATLDLYKCSDAVCIQSAIDTPVYAASACQIESIDYNAEIGNNVTVSLGNGYLLTYGQLKDLQVVKGDVIEEGELIGYVGTPTKYYTVEGPNLYMKMTKDGQAVDPLDYLDYE